MLDKEPPVIEPLAPEHETPEYTDDPNRRRLFICEDCHKQSTNPETLCSPKEA